MIELEIVESLATWRTDSRFEVAVCSDHVWLRSDSDDARLLMQQWPGLVFREEEGLLYELFSPLAKKVLPNGLIWQPLQDWWKLRVAGGLLPSPLDQKVRPCLVRTSIVHSSSAMRTHIDCLYQYAMQVVSARLQPFRFACSIDGDVWIEGTKQIPIAGEAYVVDGCIAIPIGYGWEPAIESDEVARVIGVGKTMRAVFSSQGSWEIIPTESMIQMNRSSVKATYESYQAAQMV